MTGGRGFDGDHALALLRTALGDIAIRLECARAPASVAAFVRQAECGAFADGRFWRAVRPETDNGSPPISVIQAAVSDRADADATVPHEPTSKTGLRHVDGTLSWARGAAAEGSAAAFFITIGAQPALDAGGGRAPDGLGFAAFGRVVSGMAVVKRIHAMQTVAKAPHPYLDGQMLADPVRIFEIARRGGMAQARNAE
jgi:peptidyl-prolyl cis-trans isomerase A (cyclophilin A)